MLNHIPTPADGTADDELELPQISYRRSGPKAEPDGSGYFRLGLTSYDFSHFFRPGAPVPTGEELEAIDDLVETLLLRCLQCAMFRDKCQLRWACATYPEALRKKASFAWLAHAESLRDEEQHMANALEAFNEMRAIYQEAHGHQFGGGPLEVDASLKRRPSRASEPEEPATVREAQHPFSSGRFDTPEEELQAVYGLQSAAAMAATASNLEAQAQACEPVIRSLREGNSSTEEIEAERRKQWAAASSAEQWRRWEAQARAFEAHWIGFDPYKAAPPPKAP